MRRSSSIIMKFMYAYAIFWSCVEFRSLVDDKLASFRDEGILKAPLAQDYTVEWVHSIPFRYCEMCKPTLM